MPPIHARGVALTAYVKPEDAARLRLLAVEADRPIAAELRRAIRSYLATTSESPAGTPSSRDKTGVGVAGNACSTG